MPQMAGRSQEIETGEKALLLSMDEDTNHL